MIEDADGAIVFNGRFGTLSEFTISVEESLNIAVIEGIGGITDEIKKLAEVVLHHWTTLAETGMLIVNVVGASGASELLTKKLVDTAHKIYTSAQIGAERLRQKEGLVDL